MKIGNKTLSTKNTKVITLARGTEMFALTIGPEPPNYLYRLQDKVLPFPKPPKAPVMLSPGKYAKEGNEVLFTTNEDDPKFVEAKDAWIRRLTAARAQIHMSYDPEITFEAVKPAKDATPTEWLTYLDELHSELVDENTGFTNRELDYIIEEGKKLALKTDLEESLRSF